MIVVANTRFLLWLVVPSIVAYKFRTSIFRRLPKHNDHLNISHQRRCAEGKSIWSRDLMAKYTKYCYFAEQIPTAKKKLLPPRFSLPNRNSQFLWLRIFRFKVLFWSLLEHFITFILTWGNTEARYTNLNGIFRSKAVRGRGFSPSAHLYQFQLANFLLRPG